MTRLRSLLGRAPRAAVAGAAVGFLNAFAWSLLTPAFHVPDEPGHFAYIQYLAEEGRPQKAFDGPPLSAEMERVLDDVEFGQVIGRTSSKPPWTEIDDERIQGGTDARLDRTNGSGQTSASNNPPLYYALQAIPYVVGSHEGPLARLYLMRILSALMAGATVFFVYLFLRELLPAARWTWGAGALAVAFQPLFGFIGGGVNSDNLLYLASAATFYAVARCFRQGLTPLNAGVLGSCAAVGLLTKLTFLAFIPGLLLALVLLVVRAGGRGRRRAVRAALLAVLIAGVPFLAYVVVNNVAWDRTLRAEGFGQVVDSVSPGDDAVTDPSAGEEGGGRRLLKEQLAYSWQLYLPRLPFQNDQFLTYFPLWETWLKGFVARFGWLDYGFPQPAYIAAAFVLGAVLLAALGALVLFRRRLRARAGESLVYMSILLGVLFLISVGGYDARLGNHPAFEQARYLLPLLGLYAAVIALALRVAGRRAGNAVAVMVVALAAAHSLWAMFATLERYYL